MAENTKIEWADRSASPWTEKNGTRVMSASFAKNCRRWNADAKKRGVIETVFPSICDSFEDWHGEIKHSQGYRIRVAPNGQLLNAGFRDATMDDLRRDLFELIDECQNLRFLLLTKRPENVRRMWKARSFRDSQLDERRAPIPGFPGYEISNLGAVFVLSGSQVCGNCGVEITGVARKKYCGGACRQAAFKRASMGETRDVFRPTGRLFNPSVGEYGYQLVNLTNSDGIKKPLLVHRIVLSVFDRPARDGEECRHLDGNASNNRIDNLAWGTGSENSADRIRHGRGRNYSKLSEDQVDAIRVAHEEGDTFSSLAIRYGVSATQISNIVRGIQWKPQPLDYRENVALICSISDQATADAMIPELLKCRDLVPILGVSADPLLGPIDLEPFLQYEPMHENYKMTFGANEWRGLGWVIVGGESGHGARPCDIAWIRSIRDQCKVAEVPCFVKQLGGNPECADHFKKASDWFEKQWGFAPQLPNQIEECRFSLKDKKGGDISEWPEDLRVREYPAGGLAVMRNKYPGKCYRCGQLVKAGDGHFERYLGGWRTQHAACAIAHRDNKDKENKPCRDTPAHTPGSTSTEPISTPTA